MNNLMKLYQNVKKFIMIIVIVILIFLATKLIFDDNGSKYDYVIMRLDRISKLIDSVNVLLDKKEIGE